ncbi:hypothetical protein MTO96_008757 [Rhipicephalus appendiculatus]
MARVSNVLISARIVLLLMAACVVGVSCISIGCSETAGEIIARTCSYGVEMHNSSLCKSALHDLRIFPWASMEQTVSFVAQFAPVINSKEDVLDLTALHRNFIYGDGTVSELECYGPKDRTISFDYAIKEIPFKSLNVRPKPSKEGPHFLPVNYTVTASKGGTVTLQVKSVPGGDGDGRVSSWTKVNEKGGANDQAENGTWSTTAVKATHRKYAIVVKRLRSGTYYDLRVLVVDQDGMYREDGAKVTRIRTACGGIPGKESWQCWSVNVVVEVNDTTLEFNLTESSTRPSNVYKDTDDSVHGSGNPTAPKNAGQQVQFVDRKMACDISRGR